MRVIFSFRRAPVAVIVAFGFACSNGEDGDAGSNVRDAIAEDADAGVPRDADASIIEDVGVVETDAGACGCTYGYHQGCAPDELCMNAFSREPMCTRTEPVSGCVATSTLGAAAPCTAQCVPAEPFVSPCNEPDPNTVEAYFSVWRGVIDDATESNDPSGWRAIDAADIPRSSGAVSQECLDFLGWTTISVMELCRGADSVRHQAPWDSFESRLFKTLTFEDNECQLVAGNLCNAVVRDGIVGGSVARLDDIPMHCPEGLPFAAPCDGPDGLACLRERIATIILALQRPQ